MNIEWSVHVSEKDNLVRRFCLNEAISEFVCHPKYSFFLGISLTFKKPDASGFAVAAEKEILTELESILIDQLVSTHLCLFSAIITSQGSRDYILYTYNPEQCMKILEVVKQNWLQHELQFIWQADPDWDVFSIMLR